MTSVASAYARLRTTRAGRRAKLETREPYVASGDMNDFLFVSAYHH